MEMKETIILVLAMIAVAIAIMLLGSMALCFRHTEKMAELGYVEVSYPGSSFTHWEKAK